MRTYLIQQESLIPRLARCIRMILACLTFEPMQSYGFGVGPHLLATMPNQKQAILLA